MKKHGRKRYFFRLFLGIVSILCIFTVLLMIGFYTSMRQYVSQAENGKNELIVSQVSYSLTTLNNTIRSLCSAIFYSPDAQVLMYHQGPDDYNVMQRMNRIKTLANREPGLIHSVYILNAGKNIFYSTYRDYIIQDKACEDLMHNQVPLPVLKPILRTFSDELTGKTQLLLSYFYYELSSTNGVMQNGVVVNVVIDEFFDALNHLNSGIQDSSKLYIYSLREERFVSGGEDGTPQAAAIREFLSYRGAITSRPGINVMDSLSSDAGAYAIVYHFWENVDWVILQVQPMLTLYEYMSSISSTLFSITLLVLALGVGAYYIVSRWLYSPVGNLVNQLPPGSPEKVGDEFTAISYALESYRKRNADLVEKHQQYIHSSKHFQLRQIIENGAAMGEDEIQAIRKEYGYKVDLSMPLQLCLMQILNFNELMQNNSTKDMALLVYAIENISKEIMDRYVANEYIEMGNGAVIFILPAHPNESKMIGSAAAEIRQACQKYLLVHTRFSLSGIANNPTALWNQYRQVRSQSKYHLIFGAEAFITPEMVGSLEKSDDLQAAIEKEEYILKKLDLPAPILRAKLHDCFEALHRLHYNAIVYVVTQMQSKLTKALEASGILQQSKHGGLEMISYETFQSQSLAQIEQILWNQMCALRDSESPSQDVLAFGIAARAKALIDIRYADSNLNAAFLAEELAISPSTLSRAFRRELDMTVPEYVNIVRMSYAIEMMKGSNQSISEIMRSVGIENESHFYRTFRKLYHVTPREYIANLEEKRNQQ